jgi:hypothetical protein
LKGQGENAFFVSFFGTVIGFSNPINGLINRKRRRPLLVFKKLGNSKGRVVV